MKYLISAILFATLFTSLEAEPAGSPGEGSWGNLRLRGVNCNLNKSREDFQHLATVWKANCVRINVKTWRKPEPPYEFDEETFQTVGQYIDWCKEVGLRCVIDVHGGPGRQGGDERGMWTDFKYHELLVELWQEIARRFKDRGPELAGYDLFNEPNPKPEQVVEGGPGDWSLLALKLTRAIRQIDQYRTIIVESHAGGPPKFSLLRPTGDPNTVYSLHMYLPHQFTHQGSEGRPLGVSYPGKVFNEYWDKNTLKEKMRPALEFARRYGVQIFAGEFSSHRWLGREGNQYVQDCLEIFEEYGWDWCYHSYREFEGWDPERDNFNAEAMERLPSTPRLELLLSYYKKNR